MLAALSVSASERNSAAETAAERAVSALSFAAATAVAIVAGSVAE